MTGTRAGNVATAFRQENGDYFTVWTKDGIYQGTSVIPGFVAEPIKHKDFEKRLQQAIEAKVVEDE